MKKISIKVKVIVMCVILVILSISVVSLVAVKSMQKSMALEKCKSDAATGLEIVNKTYPGEWQIKDGQLYKGNHLINDDYEIVDHVASLTGDTVTIFQGNKRITTTLKQNGQRAVGTTAAENVSDTVIKKAQMYTGEAQVLEEKYTTVYTPIKAQNGEVIGMWYTGVSKTLMDQIAKSFIFEIFLAGALIVAISFVLAWFIAKKISEPIISLQHVMQTASEGDLTVEQIRVKTRDEVEELAGSFYTMLDKMKSTIGEIKKAGAIVADSTERLFQNSDKAGVATNQVTEAIRHVAKGSTEQSFSINETVKTIEQLTMAIDQIASGAQEQSKNMMDTTSMVTDMAQSVSRIADEITRVKNVTDHNRVTAQAGGEVVDKTVKGMLNVKEAVFSTAVKMRKLGEQSQQIGEIVQVIEEIAEQTNLLALNAAIEAARAGEQGKGFAVVADEVRKLAEKSGKATKEIAELIAGIQRDTVSAVESMDVGTKEVEQGVEMAQKAGGSLKEIVDGVNKSSENVQNITKLIQEVYEVSQEVSEAIGNVAAITQENSAATEEMAASATEVNKSVLQVSVISEENAGSAEEVSASTEELSTSIQDIASATVKLKEMAKIMEDLVSRFKL